jgi:hypothetical protein
MLYIGKQTRILLKLFELTCYRMCNETQFCLSVTLCGCVLNNRKNQAVSVT